MDWAMEDHRQALRRIAVVLIALAGLAERMVGSPLPVRRLLLWILRRAEAVAAEFVTAELRMTGALAKPMALQQAGDRSNEAMALASGFRALATALIGLIGRLAGCRSLDRQAGVSGSPSSLHPRRSQAFHSRQAFGANARHGLVRDVVSFPDTS